MLLFIFFWINYLYNIQKKEHFEVGVLIVYYSNQLFINLSPMQNRKPLNNKIKVGLKQIK
ncbi:Uncharacterised protein [Yersinia kristensenii]|uniref:Uncharacterized protein n=1 Tax=Yersinia kristensenii TaxID=28152 RepID=A0A0T9L3E6_YERKR|nr:Uncharacterised protein [Yersinia kristensenii]